MATTPLQETIRQEIQATYEEYVRTLARRDPAELAAFYDEDAVILPPGGEPVTGAGAVRAYCEGLCALPYGFSLAGFTVDYLIAAGDLVVETSRFQNVSWPRDDPDARVVAPSKNLVVWRRRGGRWLIARDMYGEITPSPTHPRSPHA